MSDDKTQQTEDSKPQEPTENKSRDSYVHPDLLDFFAAQGITPQNSQPATFDSTKQPASDDLPDAQQQGPESSQSKDAASTSQQETAEKVSEISASLQQETKNTATPEVQLSTATNPEQGSLLQENASPQPTAGPAYDPDMEGIVTSDHFPPTETSQSSDSTSKLGTLSHVKTAGQTDTTNNTETTLIPHQEELVTPEGTTEQSQTLAYDAITGSSDAYLKENTQNFTRSQSNNTGQASVDTTGANTVSTADTSEDSYPEGIRPELTNTNENTTATTSDATPFSDLSTPVVDETESEAANPSNDVDEDEEQSTGRDRPMTLREHLVELRKRLFYTLLFCLVGFCICFPFAKELYAILKAPLVAKLPPGSTLVALKVGEIFFTYMKLSFVAGMFIASPFIFYQIWAFIAPGLYDNERRFVVPIALFSGIFFALGGLFCYFAAFPVAFEFFMDFATEDIHNTPSVESYLGFALQLLFGFGLVFELPLFIFFFARMGLVTPQWLREKRRYAILFIFIAAAVLTPPEVISQFLMAVPMLLLYEVGIIVAAVFGKKKNTPKEEEEEEDNGDEEDSTPMPADESTKDKKTDG